MKPGTYSQLYVHIVFAVRNRVNAINKETRQTIYKYISGIITEKNNKSIIINGTENHIHILIGLNPLCSISELVKEIKRCSTIFINQNNMVMGKFYWQEGYGVFSYGKSQLSSIYNYIKNQEEHHKRKTFKEEYISILEKFDIDYNPKYLFEFYDK